MISLFTGSTCAPIAYLASRSLAFHAGCDSRKDVLAVLAARLEGRLRGRDIGDLVPFRRNRFSRQTYTRANEHTVGLNDARHRERTGTG